MDGKDEGKAGMAETGAISRTAEHGPQGARFVKRNYVLGVVNGALTRAGLAFVHPHLVLSAFVYSQTKSNLLVGLLAACACAGKMMPQLYVSSLIEHRSRKKPFYIASAVVRMVALATTGAMIYLTGPDSRNWTLPLFFIALVVYWFAQGSGSVPFIDIVGQTITSSRLGSFFAQRGLFGAILALIGGFLVIQPIIAHIPCPLSYAVLTGFATIILGTAWVMFMLTEEPGNSSPPRERNFRQTLRGGVRMLRDNVNYRRLLVIRILARVNILTLAFYVPYGVERLGAVGLSGLFIGFISISQLTSNLVWGRVSDTKGNRQCLTWAGILFTVSPAAALVAPHLPEAFHWTVPAVPIGVDLPLCVFLAALCCFGWATQANMVGNNAYLIESAPPDRRPSYVAFLNTLTFPMMLLPAVAGALVSQITIGLDILFAAVVLSGLLSLVSALRLTEVRELNAENT